MTGLHGITCSKGFELAVRLPGRHQAPRAVSVSFLLPSLLQAVWPSFKFPNMESKGKVEAACNLGDCVGKVDAQDLEILSREEKQLVRMEYLFLFPTFWVMSIRL